MSHWYAIRTAPQREFALVGRTDDKGEWVPGILERKGYTVFLPTETKVRRQSATSRKRVAVQYPMFVRYIFVQGPVPWLHLMMERHITGVVGFDGRPAPIPDSAIQRLRAMSGSAIPHRSSPNPHRSFRAGELAEISCGPFSGQVVKIEGLHGRKAKIFVNLFGTRKLVEIDVAKLEAA